MAKRMTQVDAPADTIDEEVDSTLLTEAPDDWEFETIAEAAPTRVVFDTIGDVFIGQYQGIEHIVPEDSKVEPFDLFIFLGRDGNRYSVNTSYKLEKALADVDVDTWVRLKYVNDIPTGRGLQPMKDFVVSVKK